MLFKESRTGLNHQTFKRMTKKPEMISGALLGTISTVIAFIQELISTCRKKGHSLFYSSTSTLSGGQNTTLDVSLESRVDDSWNADGGRKVSGRWTGFTQFTILNKKPPNGYTWSGEAVNQSSGNIQDRPCMSEVW